MKMNLRTVCMTAVVLLWAGLTVCAWLTPAKDISEAERRPLAQAPQVSLDTLLSGKFMTEFEDFSLDQFPLRDTFRTIKSLFHFNVLNQSDNNDIYIADGYAVKQEYPLNLESLDHAAERFNYLYEKYLTESDVYLAIVPDKGQYLAEDNNHLNLHFGKLNTILLNQMPWATPINLYDSLEADDYYRTDVHWRQENLFEAASVICDTLGVSAPNPSNYTATALERPFYGVYYGQAALPMDPETMYILESDSLKDCRVYDYESGKYTEVYNMDKLTGRDLYEVFLSGSRSLLTIENPHAEEDRELIIFRDSFGSSIAPLLVQNYAKVTLVDIRYIQIDVLDRFLTFDGQDVLMLYSVPVLNNSQTIK
jgi:hypothetical protein